MRLINKLTRGIFLPAMLLAFFGIADSDAASQFRRLTILNTQLPPLTPNQSYYVDIFADGGVPFSMSPNTYKWCLSGSLPPGVTASPGTCFYGSPNYPLAESSWSAATDRLSLSANPVPCPANFIGSYKLTIAVRDFNDNNASSTDSNEDNITEKNFVITMNMTVGPNACPTTSLSTTTTIATTTTTTLTTTTTIATTTTTTVTTTTTIATTTTTTVPATTTTTTTTLPGDQCHQSGMSLKNNNLGTLSYRASNGSCEDWRSNNTITILETVSYYTVYNNSNCSGTPSCTINYAYIKSFDDNNNCRVMITNITSSSCAFTKQGNP